MSANVTLGVPRRWLWRGVGVVAVAALVGVAFWLGRTMHRGAAEPGRVDDAHVPHDGAVEEREDRVLYWSCAMHPQVRAPSAGTCPSCGMALEPIRAGQERLGARALALSPAAAARAGIRTSRVERKFVAAEVRMVGKVDFDESRLATIAAWVAGRLDRLYVDYTGVAVRKGDHLVYLYSPDLYATQEELVQALKVAEEARRSSLAAVRESAQATVDAAREKLRLLGLAPEQIARVERSRKASAHTIIHAPTGGIVVRKDAVQGMYVRTGPRIYTIADLSRVWVKLDAYESDLVWVRYGQEVEFAAEAYPGRRFVGSIAFIAPVLDERSRTVKVRLNVDNARGLLKPGMFVRAVLRATLTDEGRVMEPRLAGKWISPMHPEILKDEPGTCDVCGMPLVRAESLGYAGPATEAKPPLVVPAAAPLITGTRAVVYVQPDARKPTFEGREVVLGPRAGDYYVVREGLREGELVATAGAFKLDAELQIQAKKSMLSMPGGPIAPPPARELPPLRVPDSFRAQLTAVLAAYLDAWRALAADRPAGARAAGQSLVQAVDAVDARPLGDHGRGLWLRERGGLRKAAARLAGADNLVAQREAFDGLSAALPVLLKAFGHAHAKQIAEFQCPMAFNNRGATWLQDHDDLLNPYFGAEMLKCGVKLRTLE